MILLPSRRSGQYIEPSRLIDVMALVQGLALHGNALREGYLTEPHDSALSPPV